MQYLSAPLARLITPPQTAIVDHLPNGGLLMSATTETFKVDNPTHLAVARDIAAATEPLNKLPCVHDPDLS
ncbi:Imm52 family immunity protein [Methylovirgula sp. HY1]|uniref:Imm52 family immunity protein n=1 Tax=Methylovirgula sp. HY1 TaxID=2822761 RepID=UPI001C5B3B6C